MSSAIFRSSKRASLAIAAAAALSTPVIANAALSMFIQIPGLAGDSITPGAPKDSSDVLAWSWGLSSTIGRAGGGAGRANLQDLSITKFFGVSSPDIFEAVALGKHFAKATLSVFKPGATGPTLYLKIDLTNVAFTSESTGGSGGEDRITENVSMIFDTITITDPIKNESDCFNAVTNSRC
jgi:type VI secretion system secreted protein Hcp